MACGFYVAHKRISHKASIAFLVLVIAQMAHSVEEYHFRLYDVFPPVRFISGLISTDPRTGFIAFNVAFCRVRFLVLCRRARDRQQRFR